MSLRLRWMNYNIFLFSSLFRYIVSDCDSVKVMVEDAHYLQDTNEDAVAQTLKAGKFFYLTLLSPFFWVDPFLLFYQTP